MISTVFVGLRLSCFPLTGGAVERKCLECHDDDYSPDFHHEE
jgi:hypothetical protein